jgi:hypothetical protein
MSDSAQPKPGPWRAILPLWLAVAAAMLWLRFDAVAALDLRDPDDTMRLVQVERWLDTGEWFGLREPRLAPPEGTLMHWSRLPDLPLAAAVLAVEPFAGREAALAAAAAAVPLLYLLAFLLLVWWCAGLAWGRDAGFWAACVAVLGTPVVAQFLPGRIDHHGLQVLLLLAMLGASIRLYAAGGAAPRWAALSGGAAGLALAIGIEALPQVAAAYGVAGLAWVMGRPGCARAPAAMAVAAAATGTTALLATVPRGPQFDAACDSLSVVYVTALALAAAAALALTVLGNWLRRPAARAAAALALAALVAGALPLLFPHCRSGPYAALPPHLVGDWLEQIDEARSALRLLADDPGLFLGRFLVPLAGLATLALGARRLRRQDGWLPVLAFLAVTFGVAALQIRGATAAGAVGLVAVAPAYRALAGWAARRVPRLPLLAAGAAVLLASPLAISAAGRAVLPEGPPGRGAAKPCGLPGAARVLDRLPPGTVMAPVNLGPMVLAFSGQSALGAPYHRNVEGLSASLSFFRASGDAEALRIAVAAGADYVAFCPADHAYGLRGARPGTLARRLLDRALPAWMAPAAERSGFRVYRIIPARETVP